MLYKLLLNWHKLKTTFFKIIYFGIQIMGIQGKCSWCEKITMIYILIFSIDFEVKYVWDIFTRFTHSASVTSKSTILRSVKSERIKRKRRKLSVNKSRQNHDLVMNVMMNVFPAEVMQCLAPHLQMESEDHTCNRRFRVTDENCSFVIWLWLHSEH